ncbi:DUF2956 domain-containing protein [Marinobacterium arenosum]|uniref:DUF2956 domain-containing protein n=1 Tax=Marinobacterium arenosum TaxID=2862496 RepID=UPI001C937A15|nr:DUF2956 domain-containing protein [Marinobacterium arenosum]MBY4678546.1 DUF2956 domain-containing protein [Marinobacterium arenosum]
MAKYSKKAPVSEETKAEALQIARANQRPGQSKEQTKLIAQGIQKGIEQYKKQQKARAREADKQRRKVRAETTPSQAVEETLNAQPRGQWLPWLLLVLSWLFFVAYLFWQV